MASHKLFKALDANDWTICAGLAVFFIGLSWALSVAWALVALGAIVAAIGIAGAR